MSEPDTIRKVAILLATLDTATADAVIDEMDPLEADRARQMMMSLGEVDPAELEAVIDEFLRQTDGPDEANSGVELDLGGHAAAQHAPSDLQIETHPAEQPFASFEALEEAEGRELAAWLIGEHPQTIAVVASHLPPEKAAEFLGSLPSDLQGEVVQRIVHLQQADPEILREVERGLESMFARGPQVAGHNFGLSGLSAILDSSSAQQRQDLINNLAQCDARLAHALQPPELNYDDLLQLDDGRLARVFATCDLQVVILALAGSSTALVSRVLKQLPLREARLLQHAMDHLGPTRLSDIEAAKQQLLSVACKLDSETPDDHPRSQMAIFA